MADIAPNSPRIEYFILIEASSEGCGEFFTFHSICLYNGAGSTKDWVVISETISWTYLQCWSPDLLVLQPVPNPWGHSACPSARSLDLSLPHLPHLKLVANRSGLHSPSAFSPVVFKAFLKVEIHCLPISTVDLSIDIWSNAYTRCTVAGFHQMGFMFPACCSTSLKLWDHSVWYGERKG